MRTYQDQLVELYTGDVSRCLQLLEAGQVSCCVTSPPYWGLRDYGLPATLWGGDPNCIHFFGLTVLDNATNHTDKRRWQHTRNGRDEEQPTEKRVGWLRTPVEQGRFCERCGGWMGTLGLEPEPALYVEHIVQVFREVRRVLKPDGTLWLNLGDSYARSGGLPAGGNREMLHMTDKQRRMTHIPPGTGLKEKDLVGMPWRVAFALQADGWWLRSDIVWAKPNPMPESVTDRPTKAHEYVFLLSKSLKYYYDADAIAEPSTGRSSGNKERFIAEFGERGRLNTHLGSSIPYTPKKKVPSGWDEENHGREGYGRFTHGKHSTMPEQASGARIVENVAKARAAGADHDAPFGATRNARSVWEIPTTPYPEAHFATFPPKLVEPCIKAGSPEGGLVLDPFVGSGTTCWVAKQLGRRSIGIDLNPDYLKLAQKRLQQETLWPEMRRDPLPAGPSEAEEALAAPQSEQGAGPSEQQAEEQDEQHPD